MPSWCSLPPTATACGCESVTACCASTSSPSSTTPRSPPITTLPSAISVTPPPTGRSLAASAPAGAPISLPPSAPSSAPPHVGASMPTGRSAIPYRVTPSSPRVEQVRLMWGPRPFMAGALIAMLAAGGAGASDLVYQPVSPSFGGSPLNGSYVLGLAGANNYMFNESPQAKQQRAQQQQQLGGTSATDQFARQ